MRVKSENVVDTHAHELLKRDRAVEGLPGGALLLAALIEIRHDHSDPAGLSADGSDDPLEVLEVIVGRHMILESEHFICLAVVDDVGEKIEVHTSDGL